MPFEHLFFVFLFFLENLLDFESLFSLVDLSLLISDFGVEIELT